jgi:dolichol-phosphate mannosyltransferase
MQSARSFLVTDPDPGQTPVAKLAMVIPTLHEAANIRVVIERIRCSLDPLGIPYELIVVDDNSGDGTDELVREMAAGDRRVRFLSRSQERGLGGAVICGWEHSDAEVLGVIDADLQHPPELLPQLWKAMEAGSDVVLASRYTLKRKRPQWHPVRHLLSRLAIGMTWPLQKRGLYVRDPMSGFFLVRRSCIKNIALQTRGFKILLEILVRADIRSVAEVPFTFGRRRAGRSKANAKVGLDYLFLLGRLWRQRSV